MTGNASADRAIFTICSWNYIPYAATLMESLRRHHPDLPLFVFVADRPQPILDALDDARIIVIDDEIVPDYERMAACYSIMEFNTAVKPHCFDYLFDRLGVERACYLDPDILVLEPLDEIFGFLAGGDDCVLTPHITQPLSDGLVPGDLEIARAGIYNLGFAAFRNSPSARAFLSWWRGWLETDCLVDLQRGIFVDQSFCDFAPAFIERTRILHDPGYNLAYWNLVHRPVESRDGRLFAAGSPVRFVHFSGVDKDKPQEFSKHQNRFTRATIGALQPVFDGYVASLRAKDQYGEQLFSKTPYGFGQLNSGVPILPAMRACFRRYDWDIPAGQSPFDIDRGFFLKPTDRFTCAGVQVNRLVAELFYAHPHLQEQFSLRTSEDRRIVNDCARSNLPGLKLSEAWAHCETPEAALELGPLLSRISRARAPNRADLSRVGKLLLFHVRSRLESLFPARDKIDELAWTLAYAFELLPPRLRSSLVTDLGIEANPKRLELFQHWLGERGFAIEPRPRGAAAPGLSAASNAMTAGPLEDAGLAIYGFLHAETGLGQAGRALAGAFETTGLPMSCHSAPAPGFENNVPFAASPSMRNAVRTALLAINADNVLNLQSHIDPAVLSRNRRIGLFFWELPVFPGVWSGACDALDEIWVSTQYVFNSLQSATSRPVRVLPLPVPLNHLDPDEARKALALPSDRLLYLTTFDFNSFPERKNPLGAVRAFTDAFPDETDSSPLLLVKCHGARNRAAYEAELQDMVSRNPNVRLIDGVMTSSDMLRLQAATDICVSLHRAEGFGLNLAESMAAGKLAIATNFSGNVDFMNEDNSILVDYDMRPVGDGEYVAWQGQWWAAPRHDDAVSALRLAESSAGLRARLGDAARKHVAAELSRERVGERMAALIRARA